MIGRLLGFMLISGLVASGLTSITGCLSTSEVPGAAEKVAKVDTEYVYEANISKYVLDYRLARRARISTFIGFAPDEILVTRESAIDDEIRKKIKRLPGIEILGSDVRSLADEQAEELARRVYTMLTEEGADFGLLAREYSDGADAQRGGQLQPFGVVNNPETYQTLAYTMQVGQISEPFSAWDGWRIIRLDNVEDDPLAGKIYHLSMILLTPDLDKAEATIVDRLAQGHTIEILDPKYNSRRALIDGDYETALAMADEAILRQVDDDLAHYLRARALWGLERTDEALDELRKAAEHGKISDALIPYYHFYRAEYLEELGRADEARDAYRESFSTWRQDISLAYDLRSAFERIGDTEYYDLIQEEIDIIVEQDSVVLAFGGGRDVAGGVITTGEGRYESSSAEYEPGYRE